MQLVSTHYSQAVLSQLAQDIVLIGQPIFQNNYIHFKYRFTDEQELRELYINSPLEFAAFALHQQLIACYDVNESGIQLYQRVIHTDVNRYNYPVSRPGYIQVERLYTGYTADEIIRMIALREYDFGNRKYHYGKLGIVISMFETNENEQTA